MKLLQGQSLRVLLCVFVFGLLVGCNNDDPLVIGKGEDAGGEEDAGSEEVGLPDVVEPRCDDGEKNGAETDEDCGGPDCEPCGDGLGCVEGSDCQSGVCDGGECKPPTCDDGVENGDETDEDCGGPDCESCGDGLGCVEGSDCESGICDDGECQAPTCADGVQNGDETDEDCGGPDCESCADGFACVEGSDCQSGVCDGGECQPPTCADGVENGDETDEDCGGPDCESCADGLGCIKDEDCQSGVCDGETCRPSSCADGVQNGDETDVDCGGSQCAACDDGFKCVEDGDCESGACDGDGICRECVDDGQCTGCQICDNFQCVDDDGECDGCGGCDDGKCVDEDTLCTAPGLGACLEFQCVECSTDAHCGDGNICRHQQCIPECDSSQPMGGGSGTAADPFRICAVSELNNIMDNPDAHYRLYRDLSLPRNFGGIGYSSPGLPSVERFRGTFNGDGYTIRNFKYDGGEEARGFFYVLGVGSHIHDLNFEDVELYGASHMGVLAAVVLGGVIEDVHAQGTLHFNAYQKFGDFSRSLGGLIGTVAPGLDEDVGRNIVKIRRSSFQGTIHPADDIEENRDVGGLIGGIYGHGGDAFVEESFADVTMQLRPDVDKFLHVGGLIGLIEGNWHNDSSIHVRDSYSIGSISIEISGEPDRMAGGLVGTLYVPKPSVTWKIENTYSLVDFPQTACGGLIGSHHNSTGTPTNSYRRSNAVTECDFDNRYGHSLEVKNGQFGSPNEFNGFNFNTTWHYSTELGRPILRWEMQ